MCAGDTVRQDGVPVRVHGAGHPAAQRAAVDPRRRVHRQVLHRVRHAEQTSRVRARRLNTPHACTQIHFNRLVCTRR